MPDDAEWSVATWEGNRRQQQRDFLALPFREKVAINEQLGEVSAFFAARRRARGLPVSGRGPECAGGGGTVGEPSAECRVSSGGGEGGSDMEEDQC